MTEDTKQTHLSIQIDSLNNFQHTRAEGDNIFDSCGDRLEYRRNDQSCGLVGDVY
jgi:hypothetical protein